MNRTSSFLAVAVVAVAAALLGVAAVRTNGAGEVSTAPGEASGTAPVSAVARACAAFGTGDGEAGPLFVGNATLKSDIAASGGSNEARLLPGGKVASDLTVDRPGTWASARVDSKASAVAINAREGLAPYSTAFAVSRPGGELGGGLALTQCPRSRSDLWFVGAGSTADHPGTLVLTNPTDINAVVNVSMFGTHEEIEVVGGTAIVVEPGKSKQIPLDELGTGEDELGVAVHASRGTIAASILDATGPLNPYRGSAYLPVAARPSTESVVGGVPAGSEGRELLIVNPGERAASVSLTVIGKDGAFTPSSLESIPVDSGAIKAVDLPDELGKNALSVRLESEVPVTAAVRLTSDSDVAYAAATEGLGGPVAVPIRVGDALDGTEVRIAATPASPDQDATVRVRAYAADGAQVGRRASIDVAAGTTVSFDPLDETGTSRGETAYVTVTTSGVGVHAAATYRDGDDIGVVPLADLSATVVRPAVSPAGQGPIADPG